MTSRPDHMHGAAEPSADSIAEPREAPRIRHARADEPERRRKPAPRRRSRAGLGRRTDDQDGGTRGERRRERTLSEQRAQWSEIRRWMARTELEPFRQLLERLAQVAFGPAATVMPHLRRSRGRKYLAFVVDAACPEAGTNYADFLPLERAFWTAYATIPKPASAFMVAVRPARGWCRAEALMPLFAQLSAPETPA